MARLSYALALTLSLSFAAACGSKNNASNADAPLINVIDASPPDAGVPDALVCVAPTQMCTAGMCTNTDTDEANCGSCGNACKGGEVCDKTCACPAPAAFLPADRPAMQGDMVIPISQISIDIGFGLIARGQTSDALIIAVDTKAASATVPNKDYTLAAANSLFAPPVVYAGYNVVVSGTPSADAYYQATAGTLRFEKVCATEMKGTLTNVTFQGAKGSLTQGSINVDPSGCTFTEAKITFDIGTTPCP